MEELLQKIKKSGLVGRGGAGFPTYKKWEMTRATPDDRKFVICNACEGEIGVFKDLYILENYPEKVMDGIILTLDFLDTKDAYLYFNSSYWKQVKSKFVPLITKYEVLGYKITVHEEEPSYIGGEETTLLNSIEGHRIEPRLKPPLPSLVGLHEHATLIQNVETFYDISLINENEYKKERFYSLSGKIKHPGVFCLSDKLSIEDILKKTGNVPSFDYFVQIGGSASGLVLNKDQLKSHKMIGAGSIEIYPTSTSPRSMFYKWFTFYYNENCGKCTPCREGTYQLCRIIKEERETNIKSILEIVDLMEAASFCGLGKSISVPVKSYIKNVLKK